MLDRLDDIDWAGLHDGCGSAAQIPVLLRELASSRSERWSQAASQLFGSIYHQGTRWEASAPAIPFLVELINSPHVAFRTNSLQMLFSAGLGDDWPDDESLPFEPGREFGVVEHLTPGEIVCASENFWNGEFDDDLQERVPLALVWARNAYYALEREAHHLLNWVDDQDQTLSCLAMSGIPWLPILHRPALPSLRNLLNSPVERVAGTALLTLGLIPGTISSPAYIDLASVAAREKRGVIRTCASIALAYLSGPNAPDAALEALLEAEAISESLLILGEKLPYKRPIRGFIARAIHYVEGRHSLP